MNYGFYYQNNFSYIIVPKKKRKRKKLNLVANKSEINNYLHNYQFLYSECYLVTTLIDSS